MADRAAPPFPPSATPPLVGRERELAALREHLAAALVGRGSLMLIGGEAGLGKTALAEWLLAEAKERGALVLVGRCYDLAETPPYGPWVELLGRYRPGPADPTRPPAFARRGTVGAVASQAALVAEVRDWLAALAAGRPLVLLLEDLHWADPASLDLLRAIGRDLADLPALLLATYRDDELTRRHPLYALLPVLEREARAPRLDLRRFDAAAIGALVADRYALAGGDAARLVAWLAGRAEGNAFFTAQLLRALEEEGVVRRADGGWVLGDLGAVGLPAPLRQVLDARLARLGEAAQHLLTLAAVIGQEVPLALWAAVAETDEDALLETIERAVDARVLVESPDGAAMRFAHALIREALYAGLLALRRRRVHRGVGEALAASGHADPDAVAYHFQRAGDERAFDWLVRAGERAWRAYAWLTAAARYEAALALPRGAQADPTRRALLLLTLAQLRRYTEPARGIPLAEEAERLAAAGDPALAAAARFDRGHLLGLAGDHRAGLAEMEGAWPALAGATAPERARLPALVVQGVAPEEDYHRGVLVLWAAAAGRYREALAYAEPFARAAPGTPARGLQGLGLASAMLGQPDATWRAYAASRAAYLAAGQHREVVNCLGQELVWAVHYRGDEPAHLARLAEERERALARASGVTHGESARFGGMCLLWLTGRWREARAVAQEAQALWYTLRSLSARPWLGHILRAQGEPELAWQLVHEAFPDGPAATAATEFPQALATQRLASALALDAGDLTGARSWLGAHDQGLDRSGAVLGRAEGALGWAAYHRAASDLARAREHAAAALTRAGAPRQPLALLAAHRLLAELATAAGDHVDAAGHLAAALRLAEACAAHYERALTLLALAELHRAQGDRPTAAATLAEARALLEPLEARPALARADALVARLATPDPAPDSLAALPFGLTGREAEVLGLVAEGLSDAQVAERLFLSRHTVKAHLRSIYGKLAVPSRTAAVRLAREHGLA